MKDKNDIVQTILDYGVNLKPSNSLWKACCPFHSEKTASFTVYSHSQSWHCFGCEAGGDVIQFVRLSEKCTYREALQLLDIEEDMYNLPSLQHRLREEPQKNFSHDLLNFYLLANKLLHQKGLSLSAKGKILDDLFSKNNLDKIKVFISHLF